MKATGDLFNKYTGVYARKGNDDQPAAYDKKELKRTRFHEVRALDGREGKIDVKRVAISKRGENFADRIVCWLEDIAGSLGLRTGSKAAGEQFLKDVDAALDELKIKDEVTGEPWYQKLQVYRKKGKPLRAQLVRNILKEIADKGKGGPAVQQLPEIAKNAFGIVEIEPVNIIDENNIQEDEPPDQDDEHQEPPNPNQGRGLLGEINQEEGAVIIIPYIPQDEDGEQPGPANPIAKPAPLANMEPAARINLYKEKILKHSVLSKLQIPEEFRGEKEEQYWDTLCQAYADYLAKMMAESQVVTEIFDAECTKNNNDDEDTIARRCLNSNDILQIIKGNAEQFAAFNGENVVAKGDDFASNHDRDKTWVALKKATCDACDRSLQEDNNAEAMRYGEQENINGVVEHDAEGLQIHGHLVPAYEQPNDQLMNAALEDLENKKGEILGEFKQVCDTTINDKLELAEVYQINNYREICEALKEEVLDADRYMKQVEEELGKMVDSHNRLLRGDNLPEYEVAKTTALQDHEGNFNIERAIDVATKQINEEFRLAFIREYEEKFEQFYQ